jgi:hypothetical protein
LPVLAEVLDARPPRHLPSWLERLLAGEAVVAMAAEARGVSNGKAKRDLGWSLRYPSWRQALRGLREAFGAGLPVRRTRTRERRSCAVRVALRQNASFAPREGRVSGGSCLAADRRRHVVGRVRLDVDVDEALRRRRPNSVMVTSSQAHGGSRAVRRAGLTGAPATARVQRPTSLPQCDSERVRSHSPTLTNRSKAGPHEHEHEIRR